MDLSKLSPAPWKRGDKTTQVDAGDVHADGVRVAQCWTSSFAPPVDEAAANAEFIAIARNAFDGDPEALAWWEANRRRRENK